MNASFPSVRYSRRDWIIAIALTLVVFLLGLGQLTRGVPYWGDDSAAYISEGIAIARGDLEAQAARNLELHPSKMPAEAANADGLVYVWGYPLLLSLVYRLVGFDAVNYSSVLYYKLPSLVCLALLAGTLYLLLRTRFSRRISAPAALVFCLTGDFFYFVNMLYSDICFLFAGTLALLLLERFLSRAAEGRTNWGMAIALGASLWYAYEVRLNGVSLCLAALCAQLIFLAGNRSRRAPRALLVHLLPYLVFFALRAISERLLAPATSNMSDLAGASFKRVIYNICYYGYFTLDYLNSLTGFRLWIGCLLFIPCVVGFLREGFRRENLHLTLLFVGTYLVAFSLPYGQRLRYLYGILPILALYLLWGLGRIRDWLCVRIGDPLRCARIVRALSCALLLCVLAHTIVGDIRNLAAGGAPEENEMYSDQAREIYAYIRENVPEDAVIACAKPRALYLNTGRRSFRANMNGHELLDASYYLCILSEDIAEKNLVTDENRERFRALCETQDYTLYQILPEQATQGEA